MTTSPQVMDSPPETRASTSHRILPGASSRSHVIVAAGAPASSAAPAATGSASTIAHESTTPVFRTKPCRIRIPAMPRALLFAMIASLLSCEKSGPLANLDTKVDSSAAAPATAPAVPTGADASTATAAHAMPPRPVPKSSPTVTITMPEQVQLQAIQYMAAMQAPQPNDAFADATYAKQIADQLRPVGKTDVISSGRRIDIVVDKCDATLPREAVARHTGSSLPALLAHGVLVVKCLDKSLQCLQSTRDAEDVLCTHK